MKAEQAVLAAMLANPNCIDDVSEIIISENFRDTRNAIIFDAIVELYKSCSDVNVISVSEKLPNCFEYIVDLSSSGYTSNAKSYAHVVEREHFKRVALGRLAEAINIIQDSNDIDADINHVHSLISSIEREGGADVEDFESIMKSGITRLEERTARKGQIIGTKTGFADLDEHLMGISETDLVIIAARPAMGKTAFAMNIAQKLADDGGKILVFSMEMSKEQLFDRLVCAISGIDFRVFKSGQLNENDYSLLQLAYVRMKKYNLTIIDRAAMHINEIRAICRKFSRKGKMAGIFVDYLQLARAGKSSNNRTEEISIISRELKAIAKDNKSPVFALSQLSRDVEKRTNKRPVASDLRESGQIEQDADLIMFMYRDEYYNEKTNEPGICEILISKNRNGETGTVRLSSELRYSRFADLSKNYRPPEPEKSYSYEYK